MTSKTYLVAEREFLENVRTKAFWIGILLLPFLFVIMGVLAVVFAKAKGARPFAVLDQSGWLLPAVEQRALQRDIGRLLDFAQGRGLVTTELPAALQPFAASAIELTKKEAEALARLIVPVETMASDDVNVSPAARAAAEAHGPALVKWVDTLTTAQAREIPAFLTRARFERLPAPATNDPEAEAKLARQLDAGTLFAYFVIGADPVGDPRGNLYVSNNQTDNDLRSWFADLVNDEVRGRRFLAEGVEPDAAQRIQEPIWFEDKQVSAGGEVTEVKQSDKMRQYAPIGFCYLLYISVLVSASMLVTNTIEEKSNRVIEVLLSSVSPLQLMTGKVLGIAMTGLTVLGSWIVFFVGGILALVALPPVASELDLKSLISEPLYFVSFVGYFVLGYLLYAAILVGIGSVCNSLKEAQNLMAPINILMIVPLIAIPIVATDPNGTVARVLSFIPLFTPFVMMNRAAGPPAAWEYVATTLVLVASIAVAFWMAAKVFRVGILMTGKPPKLTELWHWLRQPVGVQPERKE